METLSRQEHDQFHNEFARRMEEENTRQNKRITVLEENVRQINALALSVEKMAVNMENMLEEQKKQGERLEKLELEPSESYKQIKLAIITTIIGLVVGFLVNALLGIL